MIMSETERFIPGVAGVVKDGILPGYYGYETGQAAMGDAFEFVRRLTGSAPFNELEHEAGAVSAGSDGLRCIDWFNGCRTPRMDGALTGGFTGMKLGHSRGHLYRATLEGVAYGTRLIVETLRDGGVPVNRFVATGGLAKNSPLFMKILSSVLDAQITLSGAEHGSAQGAAILGALAAGSAGGGFDSAHEAVAAMAGPTSEVGPTGTVTPDRSWATAYHTGYRDYLDCTNQWAKRAPSASSGPPS
jgi:L-ribulokinase